MDDGHSNSRGLAEAVRIVLRELIADTEDHGEHMLAHLLGMALDECREILKRGDPIQDTTELEDRLAALMGRSRH